MGKVYNDIKINKLLPKSLVIEGSDSNLYRIGLSLFNTSGIKRRTIYNPIIIFILGVQLLVSNVLDLRWASIDDPEFHLMIGNLAYFTGAYRETCMLAYSLLGLSLSSQLLNWYNYQANILPSDNKIFQMMAGLIPPKSIDINNQNLCFKLLIMARKGLFAAKCSEYSMFPILYITIFILFVKFISGRMLLIIALLQTLNWSITCNYCYTIITYQTVYYYIITYYLKLKLNHFNENLKTIIKSNKYLRFSKVVTLIEELYKIHSEIIDTFFIC